MYYSPIARGKVFCNEKCTLRDPVIINTLNGVANNEVYTCLKNTLPLTFDNEKYIYPYKFDHTFGNKHNIALGDK